MPDHKFQLHPQRWDKLLTDRSKGWVCLELLSELIPQDGSLKLTSATHSVSKIKEGGLSKTWRIVGLLTEKKFQELDESYNAVNAKAMKAIFRRLAEKTGNQAYLPDVKGRDLTVSFTHAMVAKGRGRSNKGAAGKWPISFTLTITQSFSSSDPVALTGVQ